MTTVIKVKLFLQKMVIDNGLKISSSYQIKKTLQYHAQYFAIHAQFFRIRFCFIQYNSIVPSKHCRMVLPWPTYVTPNSGSHIPVE